MPKIYNEIVIDMNPESSTFEETIYEDSFEYSGDMMLAQTGTSGHEGEKATTGQPVGKKLVLDGVEVEEDQIEYWPQGVSGRGRTHDERYFDKKDVKKTYKVIEYKESQWVATNETSLAGANDMKHYADMSSAPTYVEGGSKDWGAADISKEDFVDDNGNPLTIEQIYTNLDKKLPGISGDELKAQIKDMMPKYQKVAEEEKGFLAEQKGFAERGAGLGLAAAERGRQKDVYGLQQQAGKAGAAMRGAYGGMGGGMRGAMAGGAAMGKEFGMAQAEYGGAKDAYQLEMDQAGFAERKGIYGLEKAAGAAYEADITKAIDPTWLEQGEGGALVTDFAKGGYVPNKEETFLDFLTQLPEAGGS